MIHCFNCGADLPDNLAFCLHCGKELGPETPTLILEKRDAIGPAKPAQIGPRNMGLVPKALALVAFAGLLAAVFYSLGKGGAFQQAVAPAGNTEGSASQGAGTSATTPTPAPTLVQEEMPGPAPAVNAPERTNVSQQPTPAPQAKKTRNRTEEEGPVPVSTIRPMTEDELREAKNPTKIFHKVALCNDGSREYRTHASTPLCDKNGGIKRYLD